MTFEVLNLSSSFRLWHSEFAAKDFDGFSYYNYYELLVDVSSLNGSYIMTKLPDCKWDSPIGQVASGVSYTYNEYTFVFQNNCPGSPSYTQSGTKDVAISFSVEEPPSNYRGASISAGVIDSGGGFRQFTALFGPAGGTVIDPCASLRIRYDPNIYRIVANFNCTGESDFLIDTTPSV